MSHLRVFALSLVVLAHCHQTPVTNGGTSSGSSGGTTGGASSGAAAGGSSSGSSSGEASSGASSGSSSSAGASSGSSSGAGATTAHVRAVNLVDNEDSNGHDLYACVSAGSAISPSGTKHTWELPQLIMSDFIEVPLGATHVDFTTLDCSTPVASANFTLAGGDQMTVTVSGAVATAYHTTAFTNPTSAPADEQRFTFTNVVADYDNASVEVPRLFGVGTAMPRVAALGHGEFAIGTAAATRLSHQSYPIYVNQGADNTGEVDFVRAWPTPNANSLSLFFAGSPTGRYMLACNNDGSYSSTGLVCGQQMVHASITSLHTQTTFARFTNLSTNEADYCVTADKDSPHPTWKYLGGALAGFGIVYSEVDPSLFARIGVTFIPGDSICSSVSVTTIPTHTIGAGDYLSIVLSDDGLTTSAPVVPSEVFDATHIGVEVVNATNGPTTISYGGSTLLTSAGFGATYPLTAQPISTAIIVSAGGTPHMFTIPVLPSPHESYSILVAGTTSAPSVQWCQNNDEACTAL